MPFVDKDVENVRCAFKIEQAGLLTDRVKGVSDLNHVFIGPGFAVSDFVVRVSIWQCVERKL